ncbi:TonB-dependent receptor [candidate division KSB1 bacterium]|nr:TonB-dependent receptor [candidate division KSB1 bacterium]NIR72548.1 TonB-dependent receptor [candidate division KSB1 bacterium]NIS23643.1 TonB-dependent receptor [candidate division KSB1 bacterium]NIT70567.1 TonB-dependent receptor [candidate division KSB1 bacterium]NIU24285.1 TonB-dependent receptor [candidate division KSB1 bacterium]
MRHYILIITTLTFLLATSSVRSQNTPFSAQFENEPLQHVLNLLENQLDVRFSYLDQNVANKRVTVSLESRSLPDALNSILQGTNLSFQLLDFENIFLFKRVTEKRYTIQGRVTDHKTLKGLPYAKIVIPSLGRSARADDIGNYKIGNLLPDTYNIVIRVNGYENHVRRVVLNADTILNAALETQPADLPTVEITPGIIEFSDEPSTHVSTSMETVYSPNFAKDIYRSMPIFPGISNTEFSARPSIKGGHPDETAMILDGMVLLEPYHIEDFDGPFGLINTDIVHNVKVATGGFSAKYTDKMSGVVEMQTVSEVKDQTVNFSIDFINASFFYNKKFGHKLTHFFGARRGFIDLFVDNNERFSPGFIPLWQKTTTHETDFKNRFRPTYYDIWNKIGYKVNPNSKLSFNFLFARDNFDYVEEFEDTKGEFFLNSKQNFYGWLNWKWLVNRHFHSKMTLGYQNLQKNTDFLLEQSLSNDNTDNKNIQVFTIKQDSKMLTAEGRLLEFGLELHRFYSDYFFNEVRLNQTESTADLAVIDTILVDNYFTGLTASGYLQETYRLSGGLEMLLGMRISGQSFTNGIQVAPRTALKFNLTDRLTTRLAYGWYYQPDDFHKLKTYQGQRRPEGRPEKSIHYIADVTYANDDTHVSLETYYKKYEHLNDDFSFDFVNRFELAIVDEPFDAVSGYSTGCNLFMRHKFGRSNLVSCSYSYGVNRIKNHLGVLAARDLDRTHSFALNTRFTIRPGLTVSAVWQYRSGEPYTPNQIEILGDGSNQNSGVYYQVGRKNSNRFSPSHSLDIKLEQDWQIKQLNFSSYVNILNAYDNRTIPNFAWQSSLNENNEITRLKLTENNFFGRLVLLGVGLSF